MEFSRVGEHTIRCVISEQEIEEMGYSLEDLMTNSEKSQTFMNQIFDMAEQEFQMNFDLGIRTVRADFLPDHNISLTFSEHPGAEGMMEHLKDIVNGLLNSIPQQKWEEIRSAKEKQQNGVPTDEVRVVVTLVFADMDTLIRFAKQVAMEEIPPNKLYKYKTEYMLIVDFSNTSEPDVRRLSSLTDEYASDILVGLERKAHIEEHGELILNKHALEQLRQL